MPRYRMPDGGWAWIKIGGHRDKWPRHCQAKWRDTPEWCCAMAAFQCDWKLPGGRRCDRHLCKEHALKVAPDKHLCPEHQQAYQQWLAQRPAPMVSHA